MALGLAIAAYGAPAQADDAEDAGYRAHARGDYAAAADIWLDAAQQGDAVAQFNLGLLFENGQGVEKDIVAAQRWYRQAAVRGVSSAQYNLAVLVAGERPAEALFWLEVASGSGAEPIATMAAEAAGHLSAQLSADDVAAAKARAADWQAEHDTATPAAQMTLRRSLPLVALSEAQVKALQRALAAAGYNPGPADGLIGSRTRKALAGWRAGNGLDPAEQRVPLELIDGGN